MSPIVRHLVLGLTVTAVIPAAAAAQAFSIRTVEFTSGADRVVGALYVPSNARGPRAAIVVEGPQTNVKEMVPAVYAEQLARAGYVALTFDHRNFGESGGAVRFDENPAMKVEDIRSALRFLRARPEVNASAVGLLGVCSGGGYAARAASEEPQLRAFVAIAGFYHDPAVFRQWLGAQYDARVELGRKARLSFERSGEVEYMPNVSEDVGAELAMPGHEAWEYYGTSRNHGVRWENRSATMFFEHFLTFNSIDAGARIAAPTMVIHSDAALVLDGAKRFFASLPSAKQLVWMTTRQHISFYDEPAVVAEAARNAVSWFDRQLGGTERRAAAIRAQDVPAAR